jgi:hypothetical protein
MVAFMYSRHGGGTGTSYDETFARLGWPHHKWRNVHVGQLAQNLDRYDLLLCQMVYNLHEPQDFKPHRDAWLSFLTGGGVVVVAGPQDTKLQWDWIVDLGPRFRFDLRSFRGFQKGSDWKSAEAELDFGPVAPRWAHFRSWSQKWTVTNHDVHGKPIVLYQKVGKGLLVVSTSYGGGFARAEDLSKIWDFATRSDEEGPLKIVSAAWGDGRPGPSHVDMTVRNASAARVDFKGVLKGFNEGAESVTRTQSIAIDAGQTTKLSLPCKIGDGANELSLVLQSNADGTVYLRTGGRHDLIDVRGAMQALDERIEAAGAALGGLEGWPRPILDVALTQHEQLVAASVGLKAECEAKDADRRACRDRILAAAARVKVLAAQAQTWRHLAFVPEPGRRFVVSSSDARSRAFRDRPWTSPVATKLYLELAANEHESTEIVIVPLPGGVKDVRVVCSELKSPAASIRDVQVRPVADLYVPLHGERAGWYPDVLLTKTLFDVPADRVARGVWITVHTAPDTPAGLYAGTVTVSAAGCDAVELPITVKVWGFTVPQKRNLPTEFSLRPHQLARFYFGQKAFNEFPKYLTAPVYRQLLAWQLKYRIAPYPYCAGTAGTRSMVGYLGERRDGDTVVELDFTEYDKNTQLMLDHGVDMVCAGILFSPPEAYYKSFLPKMYEHLREKGWDRKAFIYGWDEFKPEKLAEVRQDHAWIKQFAPTFRHLIPVNHAENLPDPDDPGIMDIWVPVLGLYSRQFADERAKHGQSVWAYIVNGSEGSFDVQRSMDHYRSLFWNLWRRRCAGFLYYGTTFYHWAPGTADFNPDGSPKKTFLGPVGSNMDFLCYPAGARPEDGLNASVRLEAIRDGIEDWEYLHLLRSLLESRPKTLAQVRDAARLLDEIDGGVAPTGLPPEAMDRLAERGTLLTQRRRVAEAIEKLAGARAD